MSSIYAHPALVADSFQLILNELVKDIKEINERLAVVGIYYLGKLTNFFNSMLDLKIGFFAILSN